MPVLKPEIHKIMQEALRASKGQEATKDIKDVLDEEGLGLSDLIKSLKETRDFSESEHTRTRINESFLKMHGAMKDDAVTVPSITIVIADSKGEEDNNIFLPRELLKINQTKETTVQ